LDTTDKKNGILKSAGICFARYGYEKTTLEDIGKPVGLNKASIYYYYKNKESIFSDVIKKETEIFLSGMNEKIEKIDPVEKKVLYYMKERFKYLEKTMNLNKLTLEVTNKNKTLFLELLNYLSSKEVDVLDLILKKAIDKKEIIKCDTKKVSENILLFCDAIKRKNFNCGDPLHNQECDYSKIEDEVKFAVLLILNGLKK
jgi:AcrR family transcriptional regulator